MRRLFVAAFLLMVAPERAEAHTPGRLSDTKPFVVTTPTNSRALYGLFTSGIERFVIQLNYDQRFAQPVEIFVPHWDELREHRPAYAVVGPGLPAPTSAELAMLPAPLPPGWGAVLELNQVAPRPVFFESFMRRFYWTSEPLAVVFPKGPSEIWIWSPAHTKGKFGIGIGVEEGGGYLSVFRDWSFYAY